MKPPEQPQNPVFPAVPVALIAVDLDGTLLRLDRTLHPDDVAALREASERGIHVVLATARPPRSAAPIYDALGLSTPTLNYNGAMIYAPATGTVLDHRPLLAQTAREVVRLARETDPGVLVSVEVMDTWHTDRLDPALMTETARAFEPDHLGPLDDVLSRDVTKVMLLAETGRLERVHAVLRQALAGKIAIAMSDGHLLQVMNPAVDKAVALARVARELHVDPAQIMAIGDAPNDVGMLRFAGFGVAVGNAWDEAKAAAQAIAPSNDAGGVGWAVRKFALGR